MTSKGLPLHNGIDHIGYAAIGAGIAIEAAGLADLPWWYYVIVAGVTVGWSLIVAILRRLP